jgi:transcriptional antiterminator RfaH
MAFWACAQTHPFKTKLAITNLTAIGFTTYVPHIVERIRNHGKIVNRTTLLFPTYIFISIDLQWHAICAAPGVIRLIRDGMAPARVPDRVIADIRAREVDGLIQLPERQQLRPGARVRVVGGPLRGLEGLVADMSGSERIGVLLHLLGSQRRIEISKDQVAVARD